MSTACDGALVGIVPNTVKEGNAFRNSFYQINEIQLFAVCLGDVESGYGECYSRIYDELRHSVLLQFDHDIDGPNS
jgi:hypothetical protein